MASICSAGVMPETSRRRTLAARRRIKPEGAKIETPADLLPHVRHYADRKQEHFLCATINGANEILNIRVISIAPLIGEAVARIFKEESVSSLFN